MRPADLKKLSLDDLLTLKRELDSAIEQRAAKEREALKKKLARLNGVAGKRARNGGGSALLGRSVRPKYRNPHDPSQTWAGRGLQPRWLRELIAQGQPLEALAITDAPSRAADRAGKK